MKIDINPIKKKKANPEKVKRIVNELMEIRITNIPFDFLFRKNTYQYSETNHILLDLPGIFKNTENTSVFIEGKGNLQMDYLESVLPDNKMIMSESSINLEQETGKIKDNKIEDIFNYCLSATIALKKPCYPFVTTNYEYSEEFIVREVEGFLLKIYLIIFDKNRIYKILNTLNERINNEEDFGEVEYLLFIYCLVFAKKPYAQDVVEKLSILFHSLDEIPDKYRIDLYLALCMIIKYHFQGNDEKIKELLTMISEVMYEEDMDNLPLYDRQNVELVRLTNKLSESEKQRLEFADEISERDAQISEMSDQISERDAQISERDAQILEKDNQISEKDEIILELKNRLYKYENTE